MVSHASPLELAIVTFAAAVALAVVVVLVWFVVVEMRRRRAGREYSLRRLGAEVARTQDAELVELDRRERWG